MLTNYFGRCKSIKHKTAKFFLCWGSGWGKTRTKPKQYQHTSFINEHLVRTELDDEVRLLFSISESKNMTSYSWIIKRMFYSSLIFPEGATGLEHPLCMRTQSVSHVQFFATPWSVAHQAPQSMTFFRQKYWSRLPFPTPGDLPNLVIKPTFPMSPAFTGMFFNTELPG